MFYSHNYYEKNIKFLSLLNSTIIIIANLFKTEPWRILLKCEFHIFFFFTKKEVKCIVISEHLKNSYTSVKKTKKKPNFNCMHGLKKSCPISFTLVNVESITSTITVVNAAIQFHHWQIVLLLNHSWMTVTTNKKDCI